MKLNIYTVYTIILLYKILGSIRLYKDRLVIVENRARTGMYAAGGDGGGAAGIIAKCKKKKHQEYYK